MIEPKIESMDNLTSPILEKDESGVFEEELKSEDRIVTESKSP